MINREKIRIILASASPRRKILLGQLLKNFGLKFVVKPANIAEYIPKNTVNFAKIAVDLAGKKAAEVSGLHPGIVIAADTIVVLKNKVLGKPRSKTEAISMLRALSGNVHNVYTGIVITEPKSNFRYSAFEKTGVKFRNLSEKEIKFYVSGGSPMDKAGAYGIQDDFGSTFVEKINGDYFNVVGLPIVKTYTGLKKILNL